MLGSGAFGYVLKAVAVGICPPEPETIVAVKKSSPHSSKENYLMHLTEMKIMGQIGMHLNIVNFLGACTKDLAHGKFLFHFVLVIASLDMWKSDSLIINLYFQNWTCATSIIR